MDPSVGGDKTNDYELLVLIGKGTYGKVFKTKQKSTGKLVALKSMTKIAHNEEELKLLRDECTIHSRVNHPNIIKLLDYYENSTEFVLITELAKYSLVELIKDPSHPQHPSPERIQQIACDITSALYYLHSERILHRDLKPHNVLIGIDDSARVCDFGFAKNLEVNTFLLTSMKGTPLYMAPEIVFQSPYDQMADLWSFGCILYELVTGRPPFKAEHYHELFRMIRNPIIWYKNCEGDCLNFMQGLLKKDPKKRLGWPKLLDHPYVQGRISINEEVSKYALTKALSPSQELVKETQRWDIQTNSKRIRNRIYHPGINRNRYPTPGRFQNVNGFICFPHHGVPNYIPHVHPFYQIRYPGQRLPFQRKNEINGNTNGHKEIEDLNSSDSSVDTLSSSSENENSDDEKVTVVVDSNSSKGNYDYGEKRRLDKWISGTRIALQHSIQDDPIVEDEWLAYLQTNIKEVITSPETLCEKYTFRLVVQPLRNQYTSAVVVQKIATLLSLPFTVGKTPTATTKIWPVYLESKVVANLLYASKLVVIKRRQEFSQSLLESTVKLVDILTEEDLNALEKCIQVICFLVHSDERFLFQFCDGILGFQAYILMQLFLDLDEKKERLTYNALCILCHLVRTIPLNSNIIEDVLDFGNDARAHVFWKLCNHPCQSIQSCVIRLLSFLILNSSSSRTYLLKRNSDRLWKILGTAVMKSERVSMGAKFAADIIKHVCDETEASISNPTKPSSLPIKL